MAVRKVSMCPQTGRLFVGGTAGQVIIFDLNEGEFEGSLEVVKADLVTEKEGFTWKGHPPLNFQTKTLKLPSGFQPRSAIQITPPASINSIGFSSEWHLLAVGSAHGVVVFDTLQNVTVTAKCTLNAQGEFTCPFPSYHLCKPGFFFPFFSTDIANADDNPMSRRKSLKKSLRESFRRLRKGRSQRNLDKKKATTPSEPIKREM